MPTDPNPEAPGNTHYMMDLLEEELEGPVKPYAKLAHNHEELDAILKIRWPNPCYRVAVVHALEGGHVLGGSLDPLAGFARRGVALITISHVFNKGISSAPNCLPYFPDNNSREPNQGLSEFGEEVITKMEELGIIVDVTHTTSKSLKDVLCKAKRPLLATHVSVRTLGDHPYSLLDEHIQAIASKGGVVGIPIYPYMLSNYASADTAVKHGTLQEVVRTIRYLYKICGYNHKHIGIGSDFAGYVLQIKEMACLGEIDKLRRALLKEFDNDVCIVEDIMANNVLEFFRTNWRSGLDQQEAQ
ncbi:MAG: dipeptidase [bacterium]